MKRSVVLALVILAWIAGGRSALHAQEGNQSLIANGDFAQGLEFWTVQQSCTDCWIDVQPGEEPGEHVLAWARQHSGAAGSGLWATQPLNVDLSTAKFLFLCFAVRVDSHNLPNSGWWSDKYGGSGEYPVQISLSFTDSSGAPFEWSYGFLTAHDGSTALQNYRLLPAGEWTAFQFDLLAPEQWVDPLGNPLPRPAALTGITVGGSGWDFAGAIRALCLHAASTSGGSGAGLGRSGADLVVEEYPVVGADLDTPSHFEYKGRLTDDLLAKRKAWREPDPAARIAAVNGVIGAFGYELAAQPDLQGDAFHPLYTLYHDGVALIPDVTQVWPLAVSASGANFRLLLDSVSQPTLVVTPDTVGLVDSAHFVSIAPVFVGESLFEVVLSEDGASFVLTRNGEGVYTYTPSEPWVEPPVRGLWSWNGQWVLEIDGQVIIDGESLNEQLGDEEIFDWRLIAGEPLFFFRNGTEIRLSYAGDVLPYVYQQVQHGLCCESSMFNVVGNDAMIWFHGLRDHVWYYVEAGVYE